ncbi:MAG: hypothetical protein ACERKO_12515, partial [Acetanaerobacterium sp.]
MKKNFRRILSTSVVLVLCFAMLLTACATGGDSTPLAANDDPSTPSAAGGSATNDDIVEIQILAPLFSDPPDMNNEFWAKYQELTHSKLNVEWVDSGNFHEMFHLRIASADLPEVAGVPDKRTPV